MFFFRDIKSSADWLVLILFFILPLIVGCLLIVAEFTKVEEKEEGYFFGYFSSNNQGHCQGNSQTDVSLLYVLIPAVTYALYLQDGALNKVGDTAKEKIVDWIGGSGSFSLTNLLAILIALCFCLYLARKYMTTKYSETARNFLGITALVFAWNAIFSNMIANKFVDEVFKEFDGITMDARKAKEVLGIGDEEALSTILIEGKYRSKSLHCHPDRKGGSVEKFLTLQKAKEELLKSIENEENRMATGNLREEMRARLRLHGLGNIYLLFSYSCFSMMYMVVTWSRFLFRIFTWSRSRTFFCLRFPTGYGSVAFIEKAMGLDEEWLVLFTLFTITQFTVIHGVFMNQRHNHEAFKVKAKNAIICFVCGLLPWHSHNFLPFWPNLFLSFTSIFSLACFFFLEEAIKFSQQWPSAPWQRYAPIVIALVRRYRLMLIHLSELPLKVVVPSEEFHANVYRRLVRREQEMIDYNEVRHITDEDGE